jgi:dihydrofolate synthase/folylpolyglutamate synthase
VTAVVRAEDRGPGAPEAYLLGLELFGMRFGLDRMRRMLTVLGAPQERFASVHVVGSNGKSSTTRMIAGLLSAHGRRTGSYLSPHLVSFNERVRVEAHDVTPARFAAAVEAARHAAARVDRTLEPGDRVTQFEALTAAALFELAEARVEVAVVEAGLGGRWDATNVIGSRVQVLTNVGLEHTRWLGPTVADIAAEKLDVVQGGGTLVVGPGLHPDARAVAERVVAERAARLVVAPAVPPTGLRLRAAGTFQRTNFALACAAAEAFLACPLDPAAVAATAASILVPGRFETAGERPLTILDGAHNPAGFVALAASLREMLEGRRLVAVLSILDDKDAAAMLSELLPLCAEAIATANANPRTLPPATLQSLATQLVRAHGRDGAEQPSSGPLLRVEPDPRRALARARALAGPDGVVLATGSFYLLADLKRPEAAGPASTL